jgi:hypothetical protein
MYIFSFWEWTTGRIRNPALMSSALLKFKLFKAIECSGLRSNAELQVLECQNFKNIEKYIFLNVLPHPDDLRRISVPNAFVGDSQE